MLAELRMELEADSPALGCYQSSNMQGVLMETIDSAYAEDLHRQGLNPYSQYMIGGRTKEWVVKTLTKEAYQYMIKPLMEEDFSGFTIAKKNIQVKISKKELKIVRKQELMDEFYRGGSCRLSLIHI